jgi:hydroxyacylglutathione hydrolase
VIAPTRGAGSFCAASAALEETWTTVERERLRNPAYLARDEDDFVRLQLAGLLAHPAYYREMAPINRRGATAWEPAPLSRVGPAEVERLIAGGAAMVDARPRRDFAAGHIGGAVNVELDAQFATYLGWLFAFGTRFVVVLGAVQDGGDAALQMARIGLETIAGVTGIEEWREAGRPLESYAAVDVDGLRLAVERGGVRVLDVRQELEWRDGHIPGAEHVHVVDLAARTSEFRGDGPVYVHCRSGHRAAMGASILAAAGVPAVVVDGGFPEWQERGYPVEEAPRRQA